MVLNVKDLLPSNSFTQLKNDIFHDYSEYFPFIIVLFPQIEGELKPIGTRFVTSLLV